MTRAMTKRQAKKAIRKALVRQELARRDYGEYLALTGGETWIPTRFSRFLARTLQDFIETDTGGAYDILQVASPPQHGKSMTLTEALPSWYLMRNPERRVILISYNEESAERFSRRNREKLQTWGPVLFGVGLGSLNRATEFELSPGPDGQPHRGRLISRGIMSGITGHAADLVIIDDPIKNREEADSPACRDKLWAEWVNSIKSRLAAKAKIILIMTPWHEDDLAARMRATETNLRLLRFPVEAEFHARGEADPLGRSPGEPLCPELGKDAAWLEQFKASYLRDPFGGQRAWMALYMCSPRAEEGNIVRREWWKFYEPHPLSPSPNEGRGDERESLWTENGVQIISVDAAFKGGEDSDFVAVTVWEKRGECYYLLDCQNEHWTFTETLAGLRRTRERFPEARTVLIEDKANGSAIIDVLQSEMFCVPVDPKGGKVSRVQGVAPAIESGHVYLPRAAPWLEAYLNQWTAFPAGAHDDMVDSSSQALAYLFGIAVPVEPSEAERVWMRDEREARRDFTEERGYEVYEYSSYEYGGW